MKSAENNVTNVDIKNKESNHYQYRFGNVVERDIDVLLLNSFAMDAGFINLFAKKIKEDNLHDAQIVDIELSKTHSVWGESDVTVIVEKDNTRYGILIEDKVGADAQPAQCERYFRRGEIGVSEGEYSKYYVFICASNSYIKKNKEASKYPYSMGFEELYEYFSQSDDTFSKIRREEIKQALIFSKNPYKKNVDAKATEFWAKYVSYVKSNYPNLQLQNGSNEKSSRGDWPVFHTLLGINGKVFIIQKIDKGYIDLNFSGMADKQVKLANFLRIQLGDFESEGLGIRTAGKSAVLRIDLGIENALSFQESFESQLEKIIANFEAIQRMHNIAAKLNREDVLALLEE